MRDFRFRAWTGDHMEFSDSYGNEGFWCHVGNHIEWKLMQYTGLKDKNGVEIYESDLVLVRDVRVCEVIFHKHAGCWDLKLVNALSSESIGSVSPASYKYHAEVIGNIYENPELMK